MPSTSLSCPESQSFGRPLLSKCDSFILEIVFGTTREDDDKKLHLPSTRSLPDPALAALCVVLFGSYAKCFIIRISQARGCERAFSKSHTVISSARGLNLGVFVSKAHSLSLPETSAPVSFHEINPSRRWAYHLQSGIFPIVDPVFSIRSLSVSSPLSFLHHAFWGIPVP